jgi:hypothetical protein
MQYNPDRDPAIDRDLLICWRERLRTDDEPVVIILGNPYDVGLNLTETQNLFHRVVRLPFEKDYVALSRWLRDAHMGLITDGLTGMDNAEAVAAAARDAGFLAELGGKDGPHSRARAQYPDDPYMAWLAAGGNRMHDEIQGVRVEAEQTVRAEIAAAASPLLDRLRTLVRLDATEEADEFLRQIAAALAPAD